MARERSLLALVLVCVLVHASHHLVLAQTAMAGKRLVRNLCLRSTQLGANRERLGN